MFQEFSKYILFEQAYTKHKYKSGRQLVGFAASVLERSTREDLSKILKVKDIFLPNI